VSINGRGAAVWLVPLLPSLPGVAELDALRVARFEDTLENLLSRYPISSRVEPRVRSRRLADPHKLSGELAHPLAGGRRLPGQSHRKLGGRHVRGEPAERAQRGVNEERVQRRCLVCELVAGRGGVSRSRQRSAGLCYLNGHCFSDLGDAPDPATVSR
jgi:hypothetical protein